MAPSGRTARLTRRLGSCDSSALSGGRRCNASHASEHFCRSACTTRTVSFAAGNSVQVCQSSESPFYKQGRI